MKILTLVTLLMSLIKGDEGYYNILVIDGGGIRGLIPAMMLSEIEKIAYNYKIK